MKRILVVDDEDRIRKIYKDLFRREGYEIVDASSIVEARKFVKAIKIDLVLLDINMGQYGGEILNEIMRSFHKNIKIIVCSVYPVEEQQQRIRLADDYFDKAESLRTLLKKVRFQLKEPHKKVVIIDDEVKMRYLFRSLLEKQGYETISFADNKAAIQFLKKENNKVDLFVLDLAMPKVDGCYFYEMIKAKHPEAKILVASNYPIETQEFIVFNADDYFDKSDGNRDFIAKVSSLLEPKVLSRKG